jgi:hypothetical protein
MFLQAVVNEFEVEFHLLHNRLLHSEVFPSVLPSMLDVILGAYELEFLAGYLNIVGLSMMLALLLPRRPILYSVLFNSIICLSEPRDAATSAYCVPRWTTQDLRKRILPGIRYILIHIFGEYQLPLVRYEVFKGIIEPRIRLPLVIFVHVRVHLGYREAALVLCHVTRII